MRVLDAELVHYPAGLAAVGCASGVEDEGLTHADDAGAASRRRRPVAADDAVFAGGLPVAGLGGAVGAQPRRILAVAEAEEVPLVRAQLRHVCIYHHSTMAGCMDELAKETSVVEEVDLRFSKNVYANLCAYLDHVDMLHN